MKGVILAGGTGSRMYPVTRVTNKHLLPVFTKPMIFYPMETLKSAGIKEIMIVCGNESAGDFLKLLGSGKDYGLNFTYRVQDGSGGIAEALGLAENFANKQNIAVILGDNIFDEQFDFSDFTSGARVYLKEVSNAQRFGVAELLRDKIISVEEKPPLPKSNLAVTGLYLYDQEVFGIIKKLRPSDRGELEITDVNNLFISEGNLDYKIIKGFWSDAGTFESLMKASEYLKNK
jgi:glucose-1-phosphate thymidylyltransferase